MRVGLGWRASYNYTCMYVHIILHISFYFHESNNTIAEQQLPLFPNGGGSIQTILSCQLGYKHFPKMRVPLLWLQGVLPLEINECSFKGACYFISLQIKKAEKNVEVKKKKTTVRNEYAPGATDNLGDKEKCLFTQPRAFQKPRNTKKISSHV